MNREDAWRAAGWYSDETLADALRDGCRTHPDTVLRFVAGDSIQEISLAGVLRRATLVAGGLRRLGLQPGEAIAVQVPNRMEGAIASAAVMLLGGVLVPIVHIYGVSEVGFILRQSGARALFLPARWRNVDYVERVGALRAASGVEHVIVIDGDGVGALDWRQLEIGDPLGPLPAPGPDDVAVQLYTSGTTGEPKGVRHTHNTLLAEVRSLATAFPEDAGSTVLGAFPAGHIAGLLSLLRAFVVGTSTVLLDSWDAVRAADLIQRFQVTSTSGTPYFVTSLLDAAAEGHDISSLRRFLVGAANVPPAVIERADAHGIAAYRSYGSTEHPTVSIGSPADPLRLRATTDGLLTPGTEVRIVDDGGADVPAGQPGEVITRGPELFVGYSDERFNADAFLPGGWFRTGDIAVLADGHLTVVDRKKDIIIRGGENISSKEVEDLLITHPAVADVAAVAAPHPRLGECVCVFVVLTPGAALDIEDVRRHFRDAGVAVQKTPERLEIVDELPRGHGGKVQKFAMRKQLGAWTGEA